MKNSICLILSALNLSALTSATLVRADFVVVANGPYHVSYTDPVAIAGPEGLVATTLKLANLTSNPNLNPFSFNGAIGINGQLHHEQFTGCGFPPFCHLPTPTVLTSGGSGVDSHFIRPAALTIAAEAEPLIDNSTSAQLGQFAGLTGYGGPLTANIALGTGANPPPQVVDLAYLVFKQSQWEGEGIDFDFLVGSGGAGDGLRLAGVIKIFVDDFPPDAIDATIEATIPELVEHTFTATDDDTPPDELIWSDFQFLYEGGDAESGKLAPGAVGPSFDFETQQFLWPTALWKPGTYTASAVVSEPDFPEKSDIATLTIHLAVPEPTTFGLAGLALVGIVGLIRRRS